MSTTITSTFRVGAPVRVQASSPTAAGRTSTPLPRPRSISLPLFPVAREDYLERLLRLDGLRRLLDDLDDDRLRGLLAARLDNEDEAIAPGLLHARRHRELLDRDARLGEEAPAVRALPVRAEQGRRDGGGPRGLETQRDRLARGGRVALRRDDVEDEPSLRRVRRAELEVDLGAQRGHQRRGGCDDDRAGSADDPDCEAAVGEDRAGLVERLAREERGGAQPGARRAGLAVAVDRDDREDAHVGGVERAEVDLVLAGSERLRRRSRRRRGGWRTARQKRRARASTGGSANRRPRAWRRSRWESGRAAGPGRTCRRRSTVRARERRP